MKIWTEEEVTLSNLADHILDSGLVSMQLEEERILLHTESGIGFTVALDEKQKFIRIGTYLPLDVAQPRDAKLALEHQFNETIFLPTFSLDDDDDLGVLYAMTYRFGLIPGQFMMIVNRFGSLLEYIVHSQNDDRIITLGSGNDVSVDDPDAERQHDPKRIFLN